MRTRAKNTIPTTAPVGSFAYQRYSVSSGALVESGTTGGGSTAIIAKESESIIDYPGPSKLTKTVTHTKNKFSRVNFGFFDEQTSSNRYLYTGSMAHYQSWGNYGEVNSSIVNVVFSKSKNELLRAAMKKFSMENEVDGLLNLVESPQLIESAKSLKDQVHYLNHRQPKSEIKFLKTVGGFAASNYLAYSFGIAPLISDITKINTALKSLKEKIDQHIRDYNKPITATATCGGVISINPSFVGSGFSPSLPATPNSTYWHPEMENQFAKRVVGVKGRRQVDYSSDAYKRLDYVLKRFLSNGPASYAWERVPFSFVIDWFVDLSAIIGALDNALTGHSQVYTDGWYSEKWSLDVNAIKHRTATWVSSSDGQRTTKNELSYYHREYLEPHITVGLSDRFGKKQVSYTAALLYQLVAGLKVWKQ